MNSFSRIGVGAAWVLITGLNIALLPTRYAVRAPVERAEKGSFPLKVRASGTVEPKLNFEFKAEFEGPVVSKRYKEGDRVKKGQLLLEIGQDQIRPEHQRKVIALQNAKRDLTKDRKDVTIEKLLFRKGAVAQSSVDDAVTAVIHAVQNLKTAEEDFQQAETLWNKNKIVASFDGTILKDSLGTDATVSTGKALLTLADVSEYTVVAKVDELEIGQIHLDQEADVRLQAYDAMTLKATVSDIGVQADTNALPEIPVTLRLQEQPGLMLRPHLTATVDLNTGQLDDVMSVPLTAIANVNGQTHVWRVDGSGRLRLRQVTLGRSNPDRIEIKQGLAGGETVCTTADPGWVEGMKVITTTASRVPAPAATQPHPMNREEAMRRVQPMPGEAPKEGHPSQPMTFKFKEGGEFPPGMPPEVRQRIEKMMKQAKERQETGTQKP